MEAVRFIGTSICITAVITSIFSMLVPDTRLDKVLKFAISLFFLTGLISPFLSEGLDFHVDLSLQQSSVQPESMEQAVQSQFSALAQRNLESALTTLLKQEGLPVRKVETTIHIDEQDGISITKVTVSPGMRITPAQAAQIQEIVKRETGILPEVTS